MQSQVMTPSLSPIFFSPDPISSFLRFVSVRVGPASKLSLSTATSTLGQLVNLLNIYIPFGRIRNILFPKKLDVEIVNEFFVMSHHR